MREIRLSAVIPLNVRRETMEKILSIGLFLKKYRVSVQIAVLPTVSLPCIFIGNKTIDLEKVDIATLLRELETEIPEAFEAMFPPTLESGAPELMSA